MAAIQFNHSIESFSDRYTNHSHTFLRKNSCMMKVFCVLICVCAFCTARAQNISLSGIVLDENGDGLSGAYLIAIDSKNSEVITATVADDDGKYILYSVPSRFMLNITRLGYASMNILIDCETGQNAVQIIRMQMLIDQIEDAIVTANAPRIKREVGKFIIQDVATSPFAKGSNALNFLRFMPMVEVRPEGGVSIMGKTNANILIDGRNIGSNQMAEQILKGVTAREISRIEIIPVTGSAYAADNSSGIINVILKRPNEGVRLIATLEDRQGYYNSPQGVLFVNYAVGKVDVTTGVTTSFNQLRQDSEHKYNYYPQNLMTRSEFGERTSTQHGGGYINLDYRLDKHHKLGAQINFSGIDYKNNSSSISSYSQIGSNSIDSTYTALVQVNTPKVNTNWGVNLNYFFKTDDNGSKLHVDLDFRDNINKRNTHSLYYQNIGTSSIVTDDFIQQTDIFTRVFGGRASYAHCFNESNILKAGTEAYAGKVKDSFYYAKRFDERYESDMGRSNIFEYKDYNIAGYISFQRIWSEKFESEIGIRIEKNHAQGLQHTSSETVHRDQFDIFPSLTLLYMPFDKHEFSLDLSSSITRPYYGLLNPFITYTSPSTYVQNNPHLQPCKEYELMFTYTLYDDYTLTVNYLYDDNMWTEFILPAGDVTRKYTDNFGNSHGLDVSLYVSKSLFRNFWNISVENTLCYDRMLGAVSSHEINISDISYDVTLKSNLALSKIHDIYLDLKYKYSSVNRKAAFEIGSTHEMEIYLMKQFSRASLSLGVYNILMPTVTICNAFKDYSFSITNRRYVTGIVTFSYTFGNQRTRSVEKRQNDNIEQRMQ